MLAALFVVGYVVGFVATVVLLTVVWDAEPEDAGPLALLWPVSAPLMLLYWVSMTIADKVKRKVDGWRR